MKQTFKSKVLLYLLGLLLMTIGISISIKSNFGVSPVSSIPYTITMVFGLEMGKATILFHVMLVMLQLVLLRREFELLQLWQVVVGVVFGYFTTFSNWMMSFLPTPHTMPVRLLLIIVSMCFIAWGIFLYVPTNLVPLAGEGIIKVVSDLLHVSFPHAKMSFDAGMVVFSLIACLSVLHELGSVGLGTVVAAFGVGAILNGITKLFGKWRYGLEH